MIKIIILLFLAAVLLEAGLYSFIEIRGRQAKPQKSDVLLVLGCRLHGDKPSPSLQYRLDKALELYKAGYGNLIMVSGGQGVDEIMPEARMMKKYLVAKAAGAAAPSVPHLKRGYMLRETLAVLKYWVLGN